MRALLDPVSEATTGLIFACPSPRERTRSQTSHILNTHSIAIPHIFNALFHDQFLEQQK